MSESNLHPLATAHLQRLRRASRTLPRRERRELRTEIEAHLTQATTPDAPDVEVLGVLDRLGEPKEIVAAGLLTSSRPVGARHIQEWFAIILLLFGAFAFGIGWLVGLALLWSSSVWRTRDKWLGTLMLPGGFALVPFVLGLGSSTQSCVSSSAGGMRCTGGSSTGNDILMIALLLIAVIVPLVSATHLARRLR
jgi:hypothetical protein